MAWSNIYLELITVMGPIVGEGLLDGWETAIELDSFGWGMSYSPASTDPAKGGAAGSVMGAVGGAALGMLGLGKSKSMEMHELKIEKRFDIASAQIHTCLDMHWPVLSASITVLNIKHGGRAIHEPGFTLVATNGHFTDVKLSMTPSGHGVEVKESLTLNFKSIVISYLKRAGKDNIPTNPFFYTSTSS